MLCALRKGSKDEGSSKRGKREIHRKRIQNNRKGMVRLLRLCSLKGETASRIQEGSECRYIKGIHPGTSDAATKKIRKGCANSRTREKGSRNEGNTRINNRHA